MRKKRIRYVKIKKRTRLFRGILKKYRKHKIKIIRKKQKGKSTPPRTVSKSIAKLRMLKARVHALDSVYGETEETKKLKQMFDKDIEEAMNK